MAAYLRTITSQYLGSPHRPVATLGSSPYMAILKFCLSNIFWSGFHEADATARVREGNRITNVETRVQAGSNADPVRHTFAFRVQ